jgi:flagellar biosynthetic protein FliQ
MDVAMVIDLGREALWVLIRVATPIMLISMVVGLIIALFQALTQIQEMTLTFVPKIIAIFLSLMALMPYMLSQLLTFADKIKLLIVNIE